MKLIHQWQNGLLLNHELFSCIHTNYLKVKGKYVHDIEHVFQATTAEYHNLSIRTAVRK